MIQSRDRTRLALESIGELGLEDLDRDGAVQSCVAGAVDVAHPTFPDEGGQKGQGERLANASTQSIAELSL